MTLGGKLRLKVETEIWFVRTAYCGLGEFVNLNYLIGKKSKKTKGQKTMEKGRLAPLYECFFDMWPHF